MHIARMFVLITWLIPMKLSNLKILGVVLTSLSISVYAQAAGNVDGVIRIGYLGDLSGVYVSGYGGESSVAAVKMAIRDFGGEALGAPIELLVANHQNNVDVAMGIARKWIDQEKVDLIVDLNGSAVGLGVQNLASERGIITLNTGAASTELTGSQCTRYGIHYGYNTDSLSRGTAAATLDKGDRSWYFIAADYSFGEALVASAREVIENKNGEIRGVVKAPLGTTDFSSFLLQAQASQADVIGLANAGDDTVNAIKQAHEFGITERQDIAGLLMVLSDIKSIGLNNASGLLFTTPWYWDADEESRNWTAAFFDAGGTIPTFPRAALYSGVTTYLRAVQEVGSDDSNLVRSAMGNKPINDFFARGAIIKNNGLLYNDQYLLRVTGKTGEKGNWDIAEIVRKIDYTDAYPPYDQTGCKNVQR